MPADGAARHPVALLGARGVPHALAFNLLGFVLPGLLAVAVAECLRRSLPATAGWAPRVGSQMLLLAGLAFAAMGCCRWTWMTCTGRPASCTPAPG
jgi:hypothetical protein